MQVFFAADNDNPHWSVVLQKEPRSRRVEEDNDDVPIGAAGLATPVTLDDNSFGTNATEDGEWSAGINVPVQEVELADAERETEETENALQDVDHVDEDDDDDVDTQHDTWVRGDYADVA